MCTIHDTCSKINNEISRILLGENHHLFIINTSTNDGQFSNCPVEFLNDFEVSGLPSHELISKPQAVVILSRNLKQNEGLSNGTRLIIRKINNHVIEGEILSGKHKGNIIFLPRISTVLNIDEAPFPFTRRQFPIRLAYCLTINKAQEQTINKVCVFIDTKLFSHGHFSTALSRVCNKNSIKIMIKRSIMMMMIIVYF